MDQEIEVPPFFLCPVSLEIMKDPVIVSTGITYDRESIEKWLFSNKNKTCPVTKQAIADSDLTPNHTLRRLIQSWCTLYESRGIERIPTPKPPVTKSEIEKLIRDATSSRQNQVKCLKRLRLILAENQTSNRRCLEAAGVPEFLASVLSNHSVSSLAGFDSSRKITDEALSLLYDLNISETGLKNLLYNKKGIDIVKSLTKIIQLGIFESRAYATMLLKSILKVAGPMQLIPLNQELFTEMAQILNDQISQKATKSALQILISICPWGRNRQKAVEAGVIPVIIESLLDKERFSKGRALEKAMVVLDLLCQCAEGRAEFLNHGAGIAVVSKKMLSVSEVASERAVRVLLSVGKFCATPFLIQEMLQLGVVARLCIVLQVDCGSKTKEKASELLRLHARVWRKSRCLPTNLTDWYPA